MTPTPIKAEASSLENAIELLGRIEAPGGYVNQTISRVIELLKSYELARKQEDAERRRRDGELVKRLTEWEWTTPDVKNKTFWDIVAALEQASESAQGTEE